MSFSLVQYDPEAVKVTRQHFEEHRTTITKLYTTKTLKDVMQTMEAAGFKASRRQYTQILKIWGLETNKAAKDMKAIARKFTQRNSNGKRSTIRWRGSEVDPKDIRRFISRNPDWDPMSESTCTTPSHIECETPKSTPETPQLPKGTLSPTEPDGISAIEKQNKSSRSSIFSIEEHIFVQKENFSTLLRSKKSGLSDSHRDFQSWPYRLNQSTKIVEFPSAVHSKGRVTVLQNQGGTSDEIDLGVVRQPIPSKYKFAYTQLCNYGLQQVNNTGTGIAFGKKTQSFGGGSMTGLEIYSDKMDLADLEYSNSRKRIKTSDAMVSFRPTTSDRYSPIPRARYHHGTRQAGFAHSPGAFISLNSTDECFVDTRLDRVSLFNSENDSDSRSCPLDSNVSRPLVSTTIDATGAVKFPRNPERSLAELVYEFRQSTLLENQEGARNLFVAIVKGIRKLHDQIDPFQMVFKNRFLHEQDIDDGFQKLILQTRKHTSDMHDTHLRIYIGYAEFLLQANKCAEEVDEILTESFAGRLQKVRSILEDLLRHMPSSKVTEALESVMDAKFAFEEQVQPNQGGKDLDMGLFEAVVLLCAQQPVYSHALPLFALYSEQQRDLEVAAALEDLCEEGFLEKILGADGKTYFRKI